MSTSDPIAPERLEALLRGEAGADGRERRIGALLDELTLGEISPPAELRERVRSLSAAPVAAAPRRRCRLRLRRPRRLVPALAGALAVVAVIAGVAVTQTRPPDHTTAVGAQPEGGRRSAAARHLGRAAARAGERPDGDPAARDLLGRLRARALRRRPGRDDRPAARRSARAGLLGDAPAGGGNRRRSLALDADGARHRALARRSDRDRRLRHAQRRQRERGDRAARSGATRAGRR